MDRKKRKLMDELHLRNETGMKGVQKKKRNERRTK